MPKISVLMPVYNGQKFLEESIRSIIDQSFSDWELIIINDGSTDVSENIITSFSDSRIRYFKNTTNIGLINTLNKGIDYCRGQYIARMDCDDISMPDRLLIQSLFLDQNTEYSMCGCDAVVIDSIGKKIGQITNLSTDKYLQINLLFSVPFVHPGMMIRSAIFEQFKYDDAYKYAEDYDLWCKIAKVSKVSNISQPLIKYRWHSENISKVNSLIQESVKDKIILRELKFNLNIDATSNELYLHKVTFNQYSFKNKNLNRFDSFTALDLWFSKLIQANDIENRYDRHSLMAYLWIRWTVLCLKQKKYSYMCKPSFLKVTFPVLKKFGSLLNFMSKK